MVLERLLRVLSTFISAARSNREATKLCKVNVFVSKELSEFPGTEGIWIEHEVRQNDETSALEVLLVAFGCNLLGMWAYLTLSLLVVQ